MLFPRTRKAGVCMFGAVACLALSAFGICPAWLVWTVDTLAGALQYCLSIIADLA
jgi:hypothetical protein